MIDGSHGKSSVRDEGKTPILILQIATGLVLLIAMANAANLLLARSASRKRELAIRAAMGAGRGELMSQLLVEAMLLAFAGCLLGMFLGSLTLKVLITQVSEAAGSEGFLTSQLETPVLLFALGLGLLTGLLFGLYPAWDAARAGLAGTLKDEGGSDVRHARRGAGAQGAGLRAGHHLRRAADPHRLVPEEPGEPGARGSRHEDREPDRILDLSGAQRLQAGAVPAAVRTDRIRTGRDSGRALGVGVARALDRRQQLGKRASRSKVRPQAAITTRGSTKWDPGTSASSGFR